jgi:nicotinamidase-related amidase
MTRKAFLANYLFGTAVPESHATDSPLPKRRTRPAGILQLPLRSRVQTFKGSSIWDEVYINKEFPIAATAIVICDMWDKHWCQGATERCEAIAIKMNEVVKTARDKGIQIIHAPSDTLAFYAGWPQRRRMELAPKAVFPTPLDIPDVPLPIDDTDGGCDTAEKPWYAAWTRQSPHIEIGEYDGISDKGEEIYNFFQQEKIHNLLIMGVHTNMCVLGRSFAIRNMTRWGIRCVLVRDLTDAMYDPKDRPYVSHDEGTELVVQHIEKYWCPSVLSSELLAGLPS